MDNGSHLLSPLDRVSQPVAEDKGCVYGYVLDLTDPSILPLTSYNPSSPLHSQTDGLAVVLQYLKVEWEPELQL